MYDKFKTLVQNDGFFYGVLLVLVAVSSFGLGRMSETEISQKPPSNSIQLTQKAAVGESAVAKATSTKSTEVKTEGSFVASKSGSKYHLLTCPGAKQIKEENKIFFASQEEAEKAGYSKASNCKGL
jgi:DNA/RNA endonuclease YhcR with UshA esterase domain